MVYTLANLRSMAEANMSPECFQRYTLFVEPGITAMQKDYFKGWQNFEAFLSLSVMRHSGVFKTSMALIDVDEDELTKFGDQIDVAKYRKLQAMSVFAMIEYLDEHQLIGLNTKELFHLLRKKRNTIHRYDAVLSEEDRIDFEWAGSLAYHIYLGLSGVKLFTDYGTMKAAAENTATAVLEESKKRKISNSTFMFQSTSLSVSSRRNTFEQES